MKTVLLANGIIHDYAALRPALDGCGYVIACDGGLKHAQAWGVIPDMIVGDMDSAPSALLAEYRRRGVPEQAFPAEKDDTDLALGVAYALSMENVTSLTLLGALGGRFDHALANVHALVPALEKKIPAEIVTEQASVRLTGDHAIIKKGKYETVSLLPLTTEVTGVVTKGLKYPLCGETLCFGSTRGVSNAFTQEEAAVSVNSGMLIIICWSEQGTF